MIVAGGAALVPVLPRITATAPAATALATWVLRAVPEPAWSISTFLPLVSAGKSAGVAPVPA